MLKLNATLNKYLLLPISRQIEYQFTKRFGITMSLLGLLLLISLVAKSDGFPRYQEPSNVPNILSLNSSCTAFVIGKNRIMTAKHCVMGMKETNRLSTGVFVDGYTTNFKLVNEGEEIDTHDWAVLEGDTRNVIPFKLTTKLPNVEDICWHAGYGGTGVVQNKMLCSFSYTYTGYIVISSAAIPGDSGSPVIDENTGVVVGLLVRTRYPIPTAYLVPFTELKKAWK